MRRELPTAPDWPAVISQILAAGVARTDVLKRVGSTHRALWHLERGVQPLFYRGELLVALWCEATGRTRSDVPMTLVIRGFRKARQALDRSPKLQSLPDWPPVQRVEMQGKKRRKKEAV
jgi:hypothetical protein